MTVTRKKSVFMLLAALLAGVMLFALVLAPVSLADKDSAPADLAAAVEKTRDTVSAKLGEIKASFGEKVGVDVEALEILWTYDDKVEAGVESATDDFVAMIEGIGAAYDNGDVEGIKNTAKTFTDGLKTYLGGIKDSVIP